MAVAVLRRLRRTAAAIRWLIEGRRSDHLSPAERHRRRDERVRRVVERAYRDVPFYREAMRGRGLAPGDVRTAADLARLPILGPRDVKDRELDLIPRGRRPEELVDLKTSGSSGTPRTVYHDLDELLRVVAVGGQRERRQLVGAIGGPVRRIALLMHPRDDHLDVREALLGGLALPSRWLPSEEIVDSRARPEEVADALDRFGPDVLHGYGSSIGEIFRYLDREDRSIRLPRVVTFTSDALAPPERALIEKKFGVPVLGSYRSVETPMLGFECRHRHGYHIHEDLFAVRIVDERGATLPPGESGEVTISNLAVRSTVLLNYRLDDRAAWIEGDCACGSPLPRLALKEGRMSLMIELPDGRRAHPFELVGGVFTDLPVWRWQIVQRGPARFGIRVVVDPDHRSEVAGALGARFRSIAGGSLRAEVEFVDEIPRSEGGKVLPLAVEPSSTG